MATFYALFSLEPQPPVVAHICTDVACIAGGSDKLCADLESRIGPEGQHAGNGQAIWLESPCLGVCERAPAAMVTVAGENPEGTRWPPPRRMTSRRCCPVATRRPRAAAEDSADGGPGAAAAAPGGRGGPGQRGLLSRPRRLRGAARRSRHGPGRVIREVTDSKLLGRGGAAFPTGRKWDAVARNPSSALRDLQRRRVRARHLQGPRAARGRPLRDHRGDDHRRVRHRLRARLPVSPRRVPRGLGAARGRDHRRPRPGFLGPDILGQGVSFDIELRKGAGAYICGEETSLFNSIEGYRGEPRNKPPFPVHSGLFDKPTVINNVETLVNVPGSCSTARRSTRRSARRTRPGRGSSACPGASPSRASTRRRSASPSATCSSWQAA